MGQRIDPIELERRLRAEAASERAVAPRELVPRVLDALAREPMPAAPAGLVPRVLDALARERRRRALAVATVFACAAGLVIAFVVMAQRGRVEPSATAHDDRAPIHAPDPLRAAPTPRLPSAPLADAPLAVVAPARALEDELHRVGHDADAACRFLLACVPSTPSPRAQP